MPRTKLISLDLREIMFDALEAGDGYTKLSKHFQVSRTEMRRIIDKRAAQYRQALQVGKYNFKDSKRKTSE